MRTVFAPFILILLMGVVFFSTRSPVLPEPNRPSKMADFSFEDVVISMLTNGQTSWSLSATEAFIYTESDILLLQNIHGTLFGRADHHQSISFESPLGMYHTKDGRLKLVQTHATFLTQQQPYFMICDEVTLDTQQHHVIAHGNIHINSEKMLLKGQQLLVHLNENTLFLDRNVQGSFIGPVTD